MVKKKVAILGCENSHADAFLKIIRDTEAYAYIDVVGVYSDDSEAAQKLSEKYGVAVLDAPDACVGKIDGLIITARHGRYHAPWALMYANDNIPMFIDKPITVSEEDAIHLAKVLKEKAIPVCGGSSLVHAAYLAELQGIIESGEKGKPLTAFFRAPVDMINPYGDFYFYAQHLVAMMTKLFGCNAKSVSARKCGDVIDCIVSYDALNVHLSYTNGNYLYYALVSMEKGCVGGDVVLGDVYAGEFGEFDALLRGVGGTADYSDFIAPVFIMNAIERSFLNNGAPETVARPEI